MEHQFNALGWIEKEGEGFTNASALHSGMGEKKGGQLNSITKKEREGSFPLRKKRGAFPLGKKEKKKRELKSTSNENKKREKEEKNNVFFGP